MPKDTRRLCELIAMLHSHWHKPLSSSQDDKMVVLSYRMGLEDLDIDQVERGISQVIRTHRYSTVPTVAEIREAAGVLSEAAMATAGWEAVLRAMRVAGRYRSVKFFDPTVTATVEHMGGWGRICAVETERLEWMRKEFEATYLELLRSGAKPRDEHVQGLHGGEPVMIGSGAEQKLLTP